MTYKFLIAFVLPVFRLWAEVDVDHLAVEVSNRMAVQYFAAPWFSSWATKAAVKPSVVGSI